jgi:hypothetical protein
VKILVLLHMSSPKKSPSIQCSSLLMLLFLTYNLFFNNSTRAEEEPQQALAAASVSPSKSAALLAANKKLSSNSQNTTKKKTIPKITKDLRGFLDDEARGEKLVRRLAKLEDQLTTTVAIISQTGAHLLEAEAELVLNNPLSRHLFASTCPPVPQGRLHRNDFGGKKDGLETAGSSYLANGNNGMVKIACPLASPSQQLLSDKQPKLPLKRRRGKARGREGIFPSPDRMAALFNRAARVVFPTMSSTIKRQHHRSTLKDAGTAADKNKTHRTAVVKVKVLPHQRLRRLLNACRLLLQYHQNGYYNGSRANKYEESEKVLEAAVRKALFDDGDNIVVNHLREISVRYAAFWHLLKGRWPNSGKEGGRENGGRAKKTDKFLRSEKEKKNQHHLSPIKMGKKTATKNHTMMTETDTVVHVKKLRAKRSPSSFPDYEEEDHHPWEWEEMLSDSPSNSRSTSSTTSTSSSSQSANEHPLPSHQRRQQQLQPRRPSLIMQLASRFFPVLLINILPIIIKK